VEIFTGILMGVVAGLLVKALFLKDSHIGWDAIFGVVGGVAGFYLYASLTTEVTKAVFALGSGILVAGILHELWRRVGGKGKAA
jgi:hypothetical protein